MRYVVAEDVMNWKPDLSERGGWPEAPRSSSKSQKARQSDLRDYTTEVWVVRIVNVYDDEVYTARIAGNQPDVLEAADELLCTMCRRFPGSFLKYDVTRYIPKA